MALPRELTEKRDVFRLNFSLPDAGTQAGFGPLEGTQPNGIAVTRVAILPRPGCLTSAGCLRADQASVFRPAVLSGRFLTDAAATVAAAIEAALGTDILTMLRGFESLGTDHEFGVVQKQLGLEVLNLFGFCKSTFGALIQALTDELKAASDPQQVTIELNDAQHPVLALPCYGLRWPAFVSEPGFVPESDADRETWRRANAVTLGYLRRKFYEGLRAGRKIYVVRQRRPISLAEEAVLLMELNRTQDVTLLYVSEAPPGRSPGEVELLLPTLMRGYVEPAAPGTDPQAVEPANWLRVLANASLLQRAANPT
jgi:hypothetical protein